MTSFYFGKGKKDVTLENTLIILQQIAIMFLLLAVGWTCAKIHLLTPHGTGQLSSIVLYVVNPMVILSTW